MGSFLVSCGISFPMTEECRGSAISRLGVVTSCRKANEKGNFRGNSQR
ncbi:hypothetical protein EVA_13142 [gut metagenome]|uniref:Uncharacterized protein n=1 Tax=gut metagenome TaxID=749906 RepID=J9FUU1_9ZZZZ